MQAGVEAGGDDDQPLNRIQVPGLAMGSRGEYYACSLAGCFAASADTHVAAESVRGITRGLLSGTLHIQIHACEYKQCFLVQIVVRVRPVLPHEATQQVAVTCSSDGSSVQVMLPEREFSKPAIAASSKPDAKAYEFDACLTGSTTQVSPAGLCWHSSRRHQQLLDHCQLTSTEHAVQTAICLHHGVRTWLPACAHCHTLDDLTSPELAHAG
jgi:hypothetical protein